MGDSSLSLPESKSRDRVCLGLGCHHCPESQERTAPRHLDLPVEEANTAARGRSKGGKDGGRGSPNEKVNSRSEAEMSDPSTSIREVGRICSTVTRKPLKVLGSLFANHETVAVLLAGKLESSLTEGAVTAHQRGAVASVHSR